MTAQTLTAGVPKQLIAAFSGKDQTGATVPVTPQGPLGWSSSDATVISVDQTGIATPLKAGTATISCAIAASPTNTAFTGSQAFNVAAFQVIVTVCTITAAP